MQPAISSSPSSFDVIRFFAESGTPPGREGARDQPREENGRERSVLVVDDEPETVDAVAELVEAEGIEALRAGGGREALELLRQGARPSLILLDLKMPGMDGWEFCRRLTADEELADIPVAIVTASASIDRIPERRKDAGFFTKPVDYRRLLEVVKSYCR